MRPGGHDSGAVMEIRAPPGPDLSVADHSGGHLDLVAGRDGQKHVELDSANEPGESSLCIPVAGETQWFGVNPGDVLRPATEGRCSGRPVARRPRGADA